MQEDRAVLWAQRQFDPENNLGDGAMHRLCELQNKSLKCVSERGCHTALFDFDD